MEKVLDNEPLEAKTKAEKIELLRKSSIKLKCDSVGIAKAIHYGFRRAKHTINRPDLPLRSLANKFDSIVVGEAATNRFIDFVRQKWELYCCSYDELRTDDFKNPDQGWDVVIFVDRSFPAEAKDIWSLGIPLKISVKSSVIPENDRDLGEVIEKRDIKILKGHERVEDDLPVDAVVQLYYPRITTEQNGLDFEAVGKTLKKDTLSIADVANLASWLKLEERCALVNALTFAGRQDVIAHIARLPETKRTVTMPIGSQNKRIWNAKIADVGRPMNEFAQFLRQEVEILSRRSLLSGSTAG